MGLHVGIGFESSSLYELVSLLFAGNANARRDSER
jgi:hypothetical protein